MFKHRDVPYCHDCGVPLVLLDEVSNHRVSPGDRQWKCPACGSQRPLVYHVERSLKKAG